MSSNSKLSGLNVVLGVTGGIAAYKAVDLASRLCAAAVNVRVVMTRSACELIKPKSFEAITGHRVYTSLWQSPGGHEMSHISLADFAQLLIVAPATANIIAKAANGICDDLLSTTICTCWSKSVLFAPAMNTRMWDNPITKANVEKLRQMGFKFVGPEKGRLACGDQGHGRMTAPDEIIEFIESFS